MDRAERPEQEYSGTKLNFSLDLMCRPRLSFDFYSGNTMKLEDRSTYFSFDFINGHQVEMEWEADLRHRLCKGYFIPNGNWLVVELTDLLDENCYTDRFYSGQSFSCVLSSDIILRIDPFTFGFTFDLGLEVKDPWRFNFYTGAEMRLDFPLEAKPNFVNGALLTFSFYEPPMYAYSGTSFEIGELITTNSVRFKEDGCLDNEFVYQNEDGDAIPELFNPVPVEGEPYKHDIRAECF